MPLGRGLQSIIPSSKTAAPVRPSASSEKIWHIPVDEIRPNPHQPRRVFNDDEMGDLTESIREHGILQPIIVSELTNGAYELIAGERRWRASSQLGLATVPAIVRTVADHEKLEFAIIENVQRAQLSSVDEAFSYRRLREEFGLTLEQVAQRVGKSRPHVSNMMRLLDLPQEILDNIARGHLSMGKARALLSLSSPQEQIDVMHSLMGDSMTTRDVEAAVNVRVRRLPRNKSADLQYIESELRTALGTKVTVVRRGEKGTITIEYYSPEELERLIGLIKNCVSGRK